MRWPKHPPGKRVTLGGDKNTTRRNSYGTPRDEHHPACGAEQDQSQESEDERTTRHAGYEVSQRKRKRVEQSLGWMKMVGMLKKVKLRGIDKVGWLFTFTGAQQPVQMRNLMTENEKRQGRKEREKTKTHKQRK